MMSGTSRPVRNLGRLAVSTQRPCHRRSTSTSLGDTSTLLAGSSLSSRASRAVTIFFRALSWASAPSRGFIGISRMCRPASQEASSLTACSFWPAPAMRSIRLSDRRAFLTAEAAWRSVRSTKRFFSASGIVTPCSRARRCEYSSSNRLSHRSRTRITGSPGPNIDAYTIRTRMSGLWKVNLPVA